jgi:hypothetical protein
MNVMYKIKTENKLKKRNKKLMEVRKKINN